MRRVRLVFAVVALAWMTLAPLNAQVYDLTAPLFPTWRMYKGWAVDLCWVRYETGDKVVDRYKALGYDDKWSAPFRVRRIRSVKEVREQGLQICRKRTYFELHAVGECASEEGWFEAWDAQENLCAKR